MIGLNFLVPAAYEDSNFTGKLLTVILQGANFPLKRNKQNNLVSNHLFKTCGAGYIYLVTYEKN